MKTHIGFWIVVLSLAGSVVSADPRRLKDTDQDGYADIADTCPYDAEDFDDYADEDGCPDLDNDRDGVLDVNDTCPLAAGPASHQGCPARGRGHAS